MIRPQSFEDVVRLKKCMELCKYIKDADDVLIDRLFHHLEKPGSYAQLTSSTSGVGMLNLYLAESTFKETISVGVVGNILSATVTPTSIQTAFAQSSYSGGDGGSSGNNNNNNNNNNA